MRRGVYVLSNKSMPGLLKIGYTDGDLYARVNDLSRATGVPFPFEVEAFYPSISPYMLEQLLHKHFKDSRVNNNREFFDLDVEEIDEVVQEEIGVVNQILIAEEIRQKHKLVKQFKEEVQLHHDRLEEMKKCSRFIHDHAPDTFRSLENHIDINYEKELERYNKEEKKTSNGTS